MEKLEFRTLTADEIECRVGTVTDKGVSLLMYKDARVDMRLLDEVVGPMNWKRDHELINGNLFCTVSIRDDQGQWISKQDVGVESNTEKEKGQASDAFKRACVNWGIGRELYTCPFVWVNLNQDEWKQGFNGKKQPRTRFYVTDIEYMDRRVTYLQVADDQGRVRYTFGKSMKLQEARQIAIQKVMQADSRQEIEQIYRSYPDLKNDQQLIDACTERTRELQAA